MSGLIRRVIVPFVGLRDVDDSRDGVITTHRTCASRNNRPNSLARPNARDYFLPRAVALLIRVEGDNRPGLGHSIAKAIGDAGINMSFVMAQVVGRRYSAVFCFENEADASKAATLIKGS